jgi:para-aminobenzoate synthetase component 2
VILLVDHDDSFVHILAGYLVQLGEHAEVVRANQLTCDAIRDRAPTHIVLSPGPHSPSEAPLARDIVVTFGPTTPILGVCLGHQCIAAAYGAEVGRARHPRHGMTSLISHDRRRLYTDIPSPLLATRYHSLAVIPTSVPPTLEITALADDGEIMGLRHREYPVEGVQFHPESILTEHGMAMMANFVRGRR